MDFNVITANKREARYIKITENQNRKKRFNLKIFVEMRK